MDIFDDLDFLGFVKQKLEEEIDFQEKLIENQRNNFYDKQLDYELHKELYKLHGWRDRITEYLQNLSVTEKSQDKFTLLLKSNKSLSDKIQELEEEIRFLNEEINKKKIGQEYFYSWDEGD